jgi:Na+/melibiose symporter-like transporter
MEKPPTEKSKIFLWLGITFITTGSLIAVIAYAILIQPAGEDNLWTLGGIPLLILGGFLAFVGVVTMLIHGVLKGIGR